MPLSASAILTVEEVTSASGAAADTRLVPLVRVWTDGVSGETAATATRLADNTLSLVITGGANAGTQTLDLTASANDTASELVTAITALTGWNAALEGPADAASTDMHHATYSITPGVAGSTVLDAVSNREIERMIDRATAAIERFIGHRVVSTTYREFVDWIPGRESVFLENIPVTAVTRYASRDREVMSITNSTDASDIAYASIRVRNVGGENILVHRIEGGSGDTSGEVDIDLTAGATDRLSEIETTINALGSGWTATLLDDDDGAYPATDLMDMPAQIASGGAIVWLRAPEWVSGGYTLVEETGELSFPASQWPQSGDGFRWAGRRNGMLVEYTSGWARASVPGDIKNTAIDLVRMYQANAEANPAYSSERLGGYTYSRGGGRSTAENETVLIAERLGSRQRIRSPQPIGRRATIG